MKEVAILSKVLSKALQELAREGIIVRRLEVTPEWMSSMEIGTRVPRTVLRNLDITAKSDYWDKEA